MNELLRTDQHFREDRLSVTPIPGTEGNRIDWSKPRPWHTIPNIKDFVIELRPLDWLTSLFGLRKRQPSKINLHTGFNGSMNKYIDYMFSRLRKQVELAKYEKARDTIGILMNSTSYQVASINHVFKNGHRKLSGKEVRIIAKQVDKLCKSRATDILYSRAYIPKGDTFRPLGVPTPAGRVYLHMYNNCLVEGRSVTEPGNQHGYLPGRGVITAGRDLVKMLKMPNIYEADYEGFFNKVTHAGLEHVMYGKLRLPFSEVEFLMSLNQSLVKLQPVDKIPEKDRLYALLKDGTPNPQARPLGYHRMESISGERNTLHIEYLPDRLYIEQSMLVKKEGVPQGAATSCSLATLALRHLDAIADRLVIYADDLIYFPESSHKDPVMDLEKLVWGLKVNRSKSRWIKKDGVGQVDSFKFLGIRYFPGIQRVSWKDLVIPFLLFCALDVCIGYPISSVGFALLQIFVFQTENFERLEADTRNGATLAFTDKESFLSYLAIAREILLESKYFKERGNEEPLLSGLKHNGDKWTGLRSKVKLLFGSTRSSLFELNRAVRRQEEAVQLAKESGSPFEFRRALQILADLKENKGHDNPLSGFFLSRMQSNSGSISVKQNFRLRYISGSGVDFIWPTYAWEHILPRTKLTVFIASSFACHSLAEELRLIKKGFPTIRRVPTDLHKSLSKRELELLKILVMFRDNVG